MPLKKELCQLDERWPRKGKGSGKRAVREDCKKMFGKKDFGQVVEGNKTVE